MEARRKEGSKFLKIDVFADVYVRPGNELTQSLHVVLQESASYLPSDMPIESVDPPEDASFTSSLRRWTRHSVGGQGHIVEGWEMPGIGRLEPRHPRSQRLRLRL